MSTMPKTQAIPARTAQGSREEVKAAAGRGALRALVLLVAVAAVLGTATLPLSGLRETPAALATLLVLTAVVGSRAIHISRLRINVTAGDAFMFCGLVAIGPMAAPLVAVVGILGASVGGVRHPSALRAVFNVSTVGLAASLAAHAHVFLAKLELLGRSANVVGLLAAAAIFAFANTVLVSLAIHLERRIPLLSVCRGLGIWAVSATLTSLLIGLGLQTLMDEIGAVALVTGIAGSAVITSAILSFRESQDAADEASQTSSP
jgi:hypothetical protein